MKKLSLVFILIFLFHLDCLSKGIVSQDLKFDLIIKESDYDSNYIFGVQGVNMAVDDEGKIYLSDLLLGNVKKFDNNGKYILQFGRTGTGPGELPTFSDFVSGPNGNLISYSLINGVVNIFSKTGILINSYRKEGRLYLPIFLKEGGVLYWDRKWVDNGKNYNSYYLYSLILEHKKKQNTLKSFTDAKYRKALENVNTRAFQDNWTYCEDFVYAADSKNNVYYAITDAYQIWRYRAGKSELLIKDNLKPVLFNDKRMIAEIKKEEEMRAKSLKAQYFLTIPKYWQLIYKLTVDDKDNIWIYVKSQERHGLMKYSKDGVFQKYYQVNLFSKEIRMPRRNFQLLIWKNNVYVSRYDSENGVEVYVAKIK